MTNGNTSAFRLVGTQNQLDVKLGLLKELRGSWRGKGLNIIARPDFKRANLYLQINQTSEILDVEAIGSKIPNRGFCQPDAELFGLTYQQTITDLSTGSALHIEPGIWIREQDTTSHQEILPEGEQIVTRLSSIPHGVSVLARGTAKSFSEGFPTLKSPAWEVGSPYLGSIFPSFNTAPFEPGKPILLDGSQSSDFHQYNLNNDASESNPRSPLDTDPPESPIGPDSKIDGIKMQDVVNDPIRLLQNVITKQKEEDYTFDEWTALNVSTQIEIPFQDSDPNNTAVSVKVPCGTGTIGNIPFLSGIQSSSPPQPNAQTVLVYSTFWVEQVGLPSGNSFAQLQYAQMVILNFPIFSDPKTLFSWPHVSVGTLIKAFN